MLKRGERSNTYLTHVCRLPKNGERLERINLKKELSANTVAFFSLEVDRPMLAGAARG